MGNIEAIDWKVIEGTLPANWRKLADDKKLIKRNLAPHIGGKVKDIGQILRLVLYRVAANTGLEAATAAFAAAGILTLSFVMLHKWTKRLGPYLGGAGQPDGGGSARRVRARGPCSRLRPRQR